MISSFLDLGGKGNYFSTNCNLLHFLYPTNKKISKCVFLHFNINRYVMKQIIVTTLMLLCLAGAVGQNAARDYKASLDFRTSQTSFAVSPSGEIWMSDNYDVWHTNGMSSTWKRLSRSYGYYF